MWPDLRLRQDSCSSVTLLRWHTHTLCDKQESRGPFSECLSFCSGRFRTKAGFWLQVLNFQIVSYDAFLHWANGGNAAPTNLKARGVARNETLQVLVEVRS